MYLPIQPERSRRTTQKKFNFPAHFLFLQVRNTSTLTCHQIQPSYPYHPLSSKRLVFAKTPHTHGMTLVFRFSKLRSNFVVEIQVQGLRSLVSLTLCTGRVKPPHVVPVRFSIRMIFLHRPRGCTEVSVVSKGFL